MGPWYRRALPFFSSCMIGLPATLVATCQEGACARHPKRLWLWTRAPRPHLHLLEGHLRDLAHEVVHAVTRLERDVVPRRDGLAVLHATTQDRMCETEVWLLCRSADVRETRSARTFLKVMVKSVVPNSPALSTVMSMRGATSLLMAARPTRTAPPMLMLCML